MVFSIKIIIQVDSATEVSFCSGVIWRGAELQPLESSSVLSPFDKSNKVESIDCYAECRREIMGSQVTDMP